MGKIISVCGEIDARELGFTSMHEHTINDPSILGKVMADAIPDMMTSIEGYENGMDIMKEGERRKKLGYVIPGMSVDGVLSTVSLKEDNPAAALSDLEYYRNELEEYKKVGGKSICECAPMPLAYCSMNTFKQLSEISKVNIVCGAGYYINAIIPKEAAEGKEAYMQEKVEHYMDFGDPECGAKPGFGKCAIGTVKNGVLAENEQMAIRAVAYAAKHHGMCLHIHTAFPARKKHVLDVADMLEHEIGILPERVIFCHMDSYNIGMGNPAAVVNEKGYDISLPLELIKRGFNIGLDTWSISSENQEVYNFALNARIDMLLTLVSSGYASRITLGHDLMSKGGGVQNGGTGYVKWPKTLQELLKKNSLSQEDYEMIAVKNPARILAIV